MISGLKIYFAALFLLIGAHLALAGENMVNFQKELRSYEEDKSGQRNPSQSERLQQEKLQFKNPELEVSVEEKPEQEKEEKLD